VEAMECTRALQVSKPFDLENYMTERVSAYNAEPGEMNAEDGVECSVCNNKGMISFVSNGQEFMRQCECMARRKAVRAMRLSGLEDLLRRYTMEAFTVKTSWHKSMKSAADTFIASKDSWFFAGGQVGSGKTHICTAICGELLNKGIPVRYMVWREESQKLKSIVNDPEYAGAIDVWMSAPVLYIDDLFKAMRSDDRSKPTDADIKLAFQVINHRYNDRNLRTIVSSEWMLDELMTFDEGIGSRIYERSKGCCVQTKRDAARNYRISGGLNEN